VAYDVHFRIADPQAFAGLLTYGELADEAVPVPALGPDARAIGDLHALVVALFHRVAHHYDVERLMLLYDVDLIARRLDAAAWARFDEVVREKRIMRVALRGLEMAVQFFGTPVPPTIVEGLRSATGREPTADYLRPRFRKVDILVSDLRLLTGWRSRFKLIREHLFPPPAYILASYGRTHRVLVPALYLHRAARGAVEWFRPCRQPADASPAGKQTGEGRRSVIQVPRRAHATSSPD
jgi:hypothetical protein